MARNNGRWGRVRRALNEDLSASMVTYTPDSNRAPGDTPRYAVGANIENHPQITDYIPRRFHILGLILAGGVGISLIAEAIAHYAPTLSTFVGTPEAQIVETFSNRLVDWLIAVSLLMTAAYARIVFLLKRHRLDDVRGRYRVWQQAGLLAVVLSINSVLGGHQIWAHAAGHLSSWHPLGSDKLWWIVPCTVIGTWVMVRLILDAAECRSAMLMFVLSAVSFSLAIGCSAGWSPVDSAIWSETLNRSLPLGGYIFALAGTLLTARYVVLDVQGLIEHDTDPAKPSASAGASSTKSKVTGAIAESYSEAKEAVSWIDGNEGDDEYGDEERPLSKSERKRLRKQGRNRAA